MRTAVVTSAYNESSTIAELVLRARRALEKLGGGEVIVVDGGSTDETPKVASRVADMVLELPGAGQTECLYEGIRAAEEDIVVTIDADLENPPELIPVLVRQLMARRLDVLVASRTWLPRPSEVLASIILSRAVKVSDLFSNFRAYMKEEVLPCRPRLGETFGGELLLCAWSMGARIGELLYEPPPRRRNPRVGGALRANARALWATTRLALAYSPWLLGLRARGPSPRSP